MYSKFKNVRLLTFFAYGDYSLYCKKTGADSFSNSRKAFQQSKERPLYSSKPLLPGGTPSPEHSFLLISLLELDALVD